MRFSPSAEQKSFAEAVNGLLKSADTPGASRAWAAGDTQPGLKVWAQVADLGVNALVIPEEHGGLGGTALDLAVAFDCLGYAGVPGPWIESVALAPAVLAQTSGAEILPAIAEGTARITLSAPRLHPYAVDAPVATHAFILEIEDDGGAQLSPANGTELWQSVDPTRSLTLLATDSAAERVSPETVCQGLGQATLACAAFLVGTGRRMLEESVGYAAQRRQFGRAIGEYQALKHALADVAVALDFAWPLVIGAARGLDHEHPDARCYVSAAKVAASAAAQKAARTALQVHGAIGYTMECDLSLWLLKARALLGAWGTPAHHRAQVLAHLMKAR